jgi:hypothetical protein
MLTRLALLSGKHGKLKFLNIEGCTQISDDDVEKTVRAAGIKVRGPHREMILRKEVVQPSENRE